MYTIKVKDCPEGFTLFTQPDPNEQYVIGISAWLYEKSVRDVRELIYMALKAFPEAAIYLDDDGTVDFNPNSNWEYYPTEVSSMHAVKVNSIDELNARMCELIPPPLELIDAEEETITVAEEFSNQIMAIFNESTDDLDDMWNFLKALTESTQKVMQITQDWEKKCFDRN